MKLCWIVAGVATVTAVAASLVCAPPEVVVARYALHGVLFALLLAATLTDLREMIIPDSITLPGTLLALTLTTLLPLTALPVTDYHVTTIQHRGFTTPEITAKPGVLRYNSPAEIQTIPTESGVTPAMIILSLFLWWSGIVAMMDRFWYTQRGTRLAVALFCRTLYRSPRTPCLLCLGLVGSVAIAAVLLRYGETPHAIALVSSLIGMAVGAGMIWGVRIVGSVAMQREAMGFGDVTLMGMIGAFLGWQPCVAIFFLAPFAGLAFVAMQRIARPQRDSEISQREIPYGPFLCGGTVLTVIGWQYVWEHLEPVVELGMFLPFTLLVGLALLGVILAVWRNRTAS